MHTHGISLTKMMSPPTVVQVGHQQVDRSRHTDAPEDGREQRAPPMGVGTVVVLRRKKATVATELRTWLSRTKNVVAIAIQPNSSKYGALAKFVENVWAGLEMYQKPMNAQHGSADRGCPEADHGDVRTLPLGMGAPSRRGRIPSRPRA